MRRVAAARDSLVLTDGSFDPDSGNGSVLAAAAVPCLVGLAGPLLLGLLLEPTLLRHPHFVISAVLIPVLLGATGIYAYCVLVPGDVRGVMADPVTRTLHIMQANAFATRTYSLPFEAIAAVRAVQGYDRDGYGERRMELITRRNEQILLPEGLTQAQVAELKRMLGRA
jgi:hypothetical protein